MTHRFNISLLVVVVLGALLSVAGCKKDEGGTGPQTSTPITDDLLPLVAGHQYTYTGYVVDTNTVSTPMAGTVGNYQATWTLEPYLADPSGKTWVIIDSTRVTGDTSVKALLFQKDTSTGDFAFRQTLGPFYRAIQAAYSDTAIWVQLARPSVGAGVTWTAFDTTVSGQFQGQAVAVHLQIFGKIDAQVAITDSSSAHTTYSSYRVRTWRKISVGSIVLQDDATTALLWLVKDVGPVQVDIAGDTENFGQFGVLTAKNF